jgi:hypothetical protein
MAMTQVEPLRQNFATRLYNSNDTEPIECLNNNLCPQNASYCFIAYVNWQSTGQLL